MLWCLRCNREPDEDCYYCDFRSAVVEVSEYDEDDQEEEDDE